MKPRQVKVICLNGQRKLSGNPSRDVLIAEYRRWETTRRVTPVTARILTGMFYARYRSRFKLYPVSHPRDDVYNAVMLLTNFIAEDTSIAPWVVDVFFSPAFKTFNNLNTGALCNRNVLSGWNVIEKAQKLRSGSGTGEQAEFLPLGSYSRQFGTIRV